MFWWRRKNDGFEWHEYVRTTIKLRREDRRKRIEDVRLSAVEGAKNAGAAGARAGQSVAARLWAALGRAPAAFWKMAQATGGPTGRHLRRLMNALAAALSSLTQPLAPLLIRPGIAPILGLIAIASAASAIARWMTLPAPSIWDWQILAATAIAVLMTLAVLLAAIKASKLSVPRVANGRARRMLAGVGIGRQAIVTVIAVLGVSGLAVGAWFLAPTLSFTSAGTTVAKLTAPTKQTLEGRARAVTGDTLLVDKTYIRLASIEAPELAQRCRNARGRRWRCGRSARAALARIVGRKQIVCEFSGRERMKPGSCTVGGKDIGEQLVDKGHAFAVGGFYFTLRCRRAKCTTFEIRCLAGRSAKTGRIPQPDLDEGRKNARRTAAPIKGHVSSKGKIYYVPWSPRYRRERIDARRGERLVLLWKATRLRPAGNRIPPVNLTLKELRNAPPIGCRTCLRGHCHQYCACHAGIERLIPVGERFADT